MTLRVLDEQAARAAAALCEAIVPGSSRVGPVVYVDAMLARMPSEPRQAALQAIGALAPAVADGTLAQHERTPGFAMVRALAIEAYYSDFVAPGSPGPGAWAEIDFQPPRAADLERDWSWLGITG
ncbi:MAG: hypothetical protein LKCHEGNO_00629 [Burkholderiaceae bacterium]|nr:hypothetical protein [Burkholderiaceae bacterium]